MNHNTIQTHPASSPNTSPSQDSPPQTPFSAITPELLHALTATQPLHPKQLTLLAFLDHHRDAQHPHLTIPLSYSRLHIGTGISPEYLRRGAIPRLLRNGLISVLSLTVSGTIYQLRFDHPTLEAIVTHRRTHPSEPLPTTGAPTTLKEPYDPIALQDEMTLLRQLNAQRQTLHRESFAARLTPDQVRWIIEQAKHTVDTQEGIRFIKDRFPHYETARLAILDEWHLRAQYGEQVPSTPPTEGVLP